MGFLQRRHSCDAVHLFSDFYAKPDQTAEEASGNALLIAVLKMKEVVLQATHVLVKPTVSSDREMQNLT